MLLMNNAAVRIVFDGGVGIVDVALMLLQIRIAYRH